MKKYTAQVAKPCNLHSASPQAQQWDEKIEMRVVVSSEGVVWVRMEQHYAGVNVPRASGGFWYKHPIAGRKVAVDKWLAEQGAVEAQFKGGPRGVV